MFEIYINHGSPLVSDQSGHITTEDETAEEELLASTGTLHVPAQTILTP